MSASVVSVDVAERINNPKHLEKRAIKGTTYVVLAYGLATGLRLVSSMVLSRLFMPSYFGLMALTTTIIAGLYCLSHFGLEDGVIQHARGEEKSFLLTAWTMQVARGALLFLIAIPLAFPVARIYHEHLLLTLLPTLGLSCLISSFASPSLLVMARHLDVGRITFLELLTSLVQFIVTAVWALIHPDIWALAGGKLAGEIARTVVSYYVAPCEHPRFVFEPEALRYLLSFGRWILISTALTFFAYQADRLLLGKLVSWQALGIYGIAYALSDIPRQILTQFSSRVGYPFIARFSGLSRIEFRSMLIKYRSYVLGIGALLLTLVVTTGDIFIRFMYDERYHQASWMVVILACGLWHTLMAATMSPILFLIQKVHFYTLAMTFYCLTLLICLPVGFHFLGMLGAVIAVAISDLPVYIVSGIALARENISLVRQDIQMTLWFLSLLGVALLLRHSIGLPSLLLGIPFS